MEPSVRCRDLGWECPFESNGTDGYERIEKLMRHVRSDHTQDWFELEEVHEALVLLERNRAA